MDCPAPLVYLLPVRGSDTQWYRNVLKNPSIRIDARGAEAGFRAAPIKDAKSVESVVEKFRGKHGASNVKKCYAKFDVVFWPNRSNRSPLTVSKIPPDF